MGAIALLLARRDRAAGAALMVAIAVKFTAVLLLPFLLIAVRDRPRRLRVLIGAALAAIPLVALSLALFGLSIPNLSDQSSLLTDFSIPNLVGLADRRRRRDAGPAAARQRRAWCSSWSLPALPPHATGSSGAGWSTLALIASLAWLVPWYVIWLLPLAALATSVRLRRVALALTVFLIFAFMPGHRAVHGRRTGSTSLGARSGRPRSRISISSRS